MKTKFVLSKSKLKEQFDKINDHVDRVSYSAKTNYYVAQELKEYKCDFSVHSMQAIERLKTPERCWYFMQSTNEKIIKKLLEKNILGFVIDNNSDLIALLAVLEEEKQSTNLLIRMKLQENTIKTGKYFVYGLKSEIVNQLIQQLRKDTRITKLGIHFHRKSQNINEWQLKKELENLLTADTLESIDILNMGGGLPVKYKNYQIDNQNRIIEEIKKLRKWLNLKKIQLIAEPGRYIAAPSIVLEAEIKLVYDNNIIVDCSVYNSCMDAFVTHTRMEVEGETKKGTPYTIKGITPDSMDIIRYRVFLENVEPGNIIRFLNAGAYNYQTNFCGLKEIPTEVTE